MEQDDYLVPLERATPKKVESEPTIKIQNSKYERHSGKKEQERRMRRLQK